MHVVREIQRRRAPRQVDDLPARRQGVHAVLEDLGAHALEEVALGFAAIARFEDLAQPHDLLLVCGIGAAAFQIGRASCREGDWSSDVCSSDLCTWYAKSSGVAPRGRSMTSPRGDRAYTRSSKTSERTRSRKSPSVSPRSPGSRIWRSHTIFCSYAGLARPPSRSEERRVGKVTGVQTCALPIYARGTRNPAASRPAAGR